jgi:hypothetical protein
MPDMSLSMRRDMPPIGGMSDDYLVEGEEEVERVSTVARVAQGLQVLVIALLAVLSFAVFWLVAVMLNIL